MTTLAAAAPPAGTDRRVLQARLRPARADGAWALQQAVEDALRCASFDDHGRLVLVRRLRLAAPAGGGAMAFGLTRALERAWREAARQALPALGPGDPGGAREALQADAVWFASAAEAPVAALARVLDGAPLAAWFWPAAVPALAALPACADRASRAQALVAAIDELAGPAAWPRWLAGWPEARRAALRALAPATLGSTGLDVAEVMSVHATSGPVAPPGARWRDGSTPHRESPAAAGALPAADARATARAGMASRLPARPGAVAEPTAGAAGPVAPTHPAVRLSVEPVSTAALPLPGLAARLAAVPGLATTPTCDSLDRTGPTKAAAPAEPGPVRPATEQAGVVGRPFAPAASLPRPHPTPRPTLAAAVDRPWLQHAAFTPHAGALWLINALDALDYGASVPPPAAVARLLGALFDRAGLAAADPQRRALPEGADDEAPTPAERRASRVWQARLRRWLRRHVGLSLAELAARPGWVQVTPTHVDIVLPHEAVDLRVRRRGLDRDPGWRPWFGRVIAFHFVAADAGPGHG